MLTRQPSHVQLDLLQGKESKSPFSAPQFAFALAGIRRIVIQIKSVGKDDLPPLQIRRITRQPPQVQSKLLQGSGFRVQGSGFRVSFRVQGSGFRVQGSGFRVQGSGFRVRFRFQGLGFRVEGEG